jgi:hypothetical protein
MKTSTLAVTIVSALFLVTAGCGGLARAASAAPIAQPAPPPAPPAPPNVVGASAEGVVAKAGGKYLLRADDGATLFELRDGAPMANPRVAVALHQGERVAVTGAVIGQEAGTKVLQIGSLVVTRGGEFDKVIATIAALRCSDAAFGIGDSYRLDPLHTTADARFSVSVAAGGAGYLVWVRREPARFVVESIQRYQGKAAVPVCVKP